MVYVEAYVASWIEIYYVAMTIKVHSVEAYVASWIEIRMVFWILMKRRRSRLM